MDNGAGQDQLACFTFANMRGGTNGATPPKYLRGCNVPGGRSMGGGLMILGAPHNTVIEVFEADSFLL